MKFLNLFKRKKQPSSVETKNMTIDTDGVLHSTSTVIHGGVRKVKHKQFSLDEPRVGGRVVKTMPRSLRNMKELAEKTDD